MPSWIGDTVMATPVLRAARESLPNARIVGVMRRGLNEILNGSPWLDEVVDCDMKGLFGAWRLGKCVSRAKPQAALLLPNSFRSALGLRLAGTRVRAGYNRDGRGWLLTHKRMPPVDKRSPISAVEYYAQLAEWAFGLNGIDRSVELFTTDDERAVAEQALADVEQPFAVLNPGANRADKRWPAANFAKLADTLASSRRLSIVISGSSSEKNVLESIQRAAKTQITDLSQRGLTLGGLKAVIQRAAIVITNDTGPRHVAAAVGTPVVTLFGPTDHRWTTLHGVQERILLAEPFLPEELVADRHAKACAIEKISVGDVLAAVDSMLAESNVR